MRRRSGGLPLPGESIGNGVPNELADAAAGSNDKPAEAIAASSATRRLKLFSMSPSAATLTLSLSRTCRCYCKYCAFATHQAHLHEPEEVLALLDRPSSATGSRSCWC
jgi:2-iminoacetate synthase ThiH